MPRAENSLARASYAYQRRVATGLGSRLIRLLPTSAKGPLKRVLYFLLDGRDLILGRRKELVPPRYLNFAGDGNFEATGDEFLAYFTGLGRLKPSYRVLEVGCGIGRMARPLTKYLTSGSYDGIDIVPKGIRWCQRNISPRFANFHFQLADVYNSMYNPSGHFKPAEYQFPFADNQFDFTLLTSVFTHMLTRDVEHYLREIARTLRPGGRCLATFFLLNDESRSLLKGGHSSLNFRIAREGCYIDDDCVPEHAVAFSEEYILALYSRLGLELETVNAGAWPGRSEYLSYQDITVARKL